MFFFVQKRSSGVRHFVGENINHTHGDPRSEESEWLLCACICKYKRACMYVSIYIYTCELYELDISANVTRACQRVARDLYHELSKYFLVTRVSLIISCMFLVYHSSILNFNKEYLLPQIVALSPVSVLCLTSLLHSHPVICKTLIVSNIINHHEPPLTTALTSIDELHLL